MADGRSYIHDSDFVHDFPCSPCEKSGQNVVSVKFCVDCDENLCSTCFKHHSKFAGTKRHRVLDQTSKGYSKQLLSKQCRKHGGKIIDVYCPKHDSVGCSTCIALDHRQYPADKLDTQKIKYCVDSQFYFIHVQGVREDRACEDIKFIPVVATGFDTSQELQQLETNMKTIKIKLDSLRKQKWEKIQRLNQEKESLVEQIRHVRKQLNSQLDKMEKELLDEAEVKFTQKIEAINASISDVDATLEKLEETMKQTQNDDQDTDIFISCKTGKEEMQNILYPKIDELENLLPEQDLELHTDQTIQLIMEGKRMFAAILEKYEIQDVKYHSDKNVHLSDDKKICCIHAICPLPDGSLVMTDYNNKKLKKLDPVSYNVSTLIKLPDNPTGICVVEDTRLAVSLFKKKKIQFLTLGNPVTLCHSFTVAARCRGLAHCDGLLYVCCGGSPEFKRNEERGHVEVYNCEGDLLRCFYDGLQCPVYIAVVNDGLASTMFISDFYKGVQIRCFDGVIKQRFQTLLKSILPFCLIGSKHVCISEYSTGNMYLHTCKDMHLLIEKKDLNGEPSALYIDEKTSRLFVTLDSCDFIKTFKVK